MSREPQDPEVRTIVSDYGAARRRFEALLQDARDIGERLLRLGHGLSAHPTRMIIGAEERAIDDPSKWDISSKHPLPTIDALITLTEDIREAQQTVEDLHQRLILMGMPDPAGQPGKFFE